MARTKPRAAGLHALGMKCYSLSIGSENTGGGRRFTRAADALIRKITESHFPDGFTIMNATGGWFDPQRRRFLREESRQVIVSAEHPRQLNRWCAELAGALRQKELLVIELGPRRRLRFEEPPRRRPSRRQSRQPS